MRYEARALARRLFAGQWRALATDALPTSAPARRHASAADAAAPRAKTQLAPGAVFTRTRQFSAAEVAAFVGMTGDSNPIHVDSAAAAAHGLRAPILPGLLSASLFPAIIGSHFPGAVYASQTLKFKAPALVREAEGQWPRCRDVRARSPAVLAWPCAAGVVHACTELL